jgi:hypothetical protein
VRLRLCLLVALYPAAIVACGTRTGLLGSSDDVGRPSSHDTFIEDASHGTFIEDASHGTFIEDAGSPAAPTDALPPIDVGTTPIPTDCPDASATLIYLITINGILLSFDPPPATFTVIGSIACPSTAGPNSMAVDHTGLAYVAFGDGSIFRVSTRTASCQPTAFVANTQNFASRFGMGFAANANGTGETLYVAESVSNPRLASIDTTTSALRVIGPLLPVMVSPELTGTGAGDLFAFSAANLGSVIGQVDKTTARVVAQATLAGVYQGTAWAFAFWGGDFYTFTAPTGGSVVTRFRPSDGSVAEVARYPIPIVGAGVSTCAPQQ